jgi:hypothetical protein
MRKVGSDHRIPFSINQTDLLAPTAKSLVCPVDGYISGLGLIVTTAVTTGGTIKVGSTNAAASSQYVTTAGTLVDVAGLSQTIANSAVKGARYLKRPTDDSSTQQVKKGDRIEITPASFATAGAVEGWVEINTGSPYKA